MQVAKGAHFLLSPSSSSKIFPLPLSIAPISMDAFDFGNVKAEKGSAMPRHSLFSGIAKTLRVLELCLVLLFLSWILTRLPFALRVSAEFLRSPLFVFALSNAIIAALLAQSSGRYNPAADGGAADRISAPSEPEFAAPVAEGVVECQDSKQITDSCTDEDSRAVTESGSVTKVYRRSKSETVTGEAGDGDGSKTARRKLRRSETEKARENLYPQDKLSNEEFQRTIEAFIAKQMRLLREESLAIIVHPSDPTNTRAWAKNRWATITHIVNIKS